MTILAMFLVFSVIICVCNGEEEQGDKMNVGTVLFTESDNSKDCWSSENIALLTSRMMLEDLLPSEDILIMKDSGFVTDIVDYFRLVLEVVRKLTYGKTKHIMLLALTDTLGGYLHRFVIPVAKHAYYGGYIDFDSMDRLYQLFDELKCFLRTNGHGWSKPITKFNSKMTAQPLPIQSPAPKTDPCKGLIIFDKSSEGAQGKSCPVGIPMPFFDSKMHPSAIAVPFKTYSLRNIESKSASYVLVKFYMAATKCLALRNADKKSMDEFNANFYSWLHNQVQPHLDDDKFYSAFGGVLRIEETLKRMGTERSKDKEMGNYNIMPEQQIKEYSKEGSEEAAKRKKSNFILIALLVTIFIWFCLGSLFICYRIKAARNRTECYCGKPEPKSSRTSRSTKPSKTSTKASKVSSKSFASSGNKSSKKPSNTSSGFSRTKKTTSSGGVSPGHTVESPRSSASGISESSRGSARSEQTAASKRGSPVPSAVSKRTTSSVASEKSTSTRSSRAPDNKVSKQSTGSQKSYESDRSGASHGTTDTQGSKRTPDLSKKSSKTSSDNRGGPRPPPPDGSGRQKPMYPASCACHTSLTGKYRMTSSSEEQMRQKEKELPLVFGYELETSSESSPRDDPSRDIGDYGAMSK